jgi:phage-related protein
MPLGNNSLYEEYSVSFNNRKKADIDDIATFLDSGKGRTNFSFTIPDTSSGGTEKVIKVVCEEYTMSYLVDNYYSLEARLRRVYEP